MGTVIMLGRPGGLCGKLQTLKVPENFKEWVSGLGLRDEDVKPRCK